VERAVGGGGGWLAGWAGWLVRVGLDDDDALQQAGHRQVLAVTLVRQLGALAVREQHRRGCGSSSGSSSVAKTEAGIPQRRCWRSTLGDAGGGGGGRTVGLEAGDGLGLARLPDGVHGHPDPHREGHRLRTGRGRAPPHRAALASEMLPHGLVRWVPCVAGRSTPRRRSHASTGEMVVQAIVTCMSASTVTSMRGYIEHARKYSSQCHFPAQPDSGPAAGGSATQRQPGSTRPTARPWGPGAPRTAHSPKKRPLRSAQACAKTSSPDTATGDIKPRSAW
jgi:hypothetical protein